MVNCEATFPLITLTQSNIFEQSKLEAIEDNKVTHNSEHEIQHSKNRKICGKRGKCWLPEFYPFQTKFLKGFTLSFVQRQDYIMKTF